MSKKQTTLFQSWGNKEKGTEERCVQPVSKPSASSADNEVIDLCGSFEDEDNALLCEAEESVACSKNVGETFSVHHTFQIKDSKKHLHGNENAETHVGDISIGADGFTPTQVQTQSSNCLGFDKCAGKLWIYPTNYPVREYQLNIVQQALYKNTMVTLPTGLGKTFIAAVVMYNFYRWYPQGKVIFMAPTKPLVAQQIEACYNIMGIPQDHTAEMTGSMGPSKREKAWHDKRVFFLTPQVLTNDLSRGSCPAHDVKCLVIDEAHKALGNHAYCQVVRELVKYTENFRILSLSATPGSDIKAVQQVLTNLLISQIEIRTEESIDIKKYSHERKVEKVVIPLGDELTKVKTKYLHIMEVVVSRLKRYGVLYNKDTTSLSKFLILKAREAFRQNPPERLQRNQYGIVEGDFALAMSLYHGYELLQLHGSRSLYNFLDGILTGDKGYGRTRTELSRNADFNELMGLLSGKYKVPESETPSQTQAKPFIIGHPKMEKLQEIVLDHFNTHSDATTRVMIFSQYRDSVQEITDMLHVHEPVVKVMSFIGQATAGKSTKGFTQKEQLKVMKEFRGGGYNTLVSTCVGEEGLDIGDVDLIICFDAHKSPIRLVQRMGRTGRKREGRIVMLVTQGKEEQIYNQSQYSKRSIHKAIMNGAKSLHFYQHSPRMLPDSFSPACHKMHITVKEGFKPTRKITAGKEVNQNKITSLMSDAASKKNQPEEIITLEEYRELEPWLVPEEDIPKLQPCKIICLEKDETPENQEEEGRYLSLSEWSPWQNTLQDTVYVDHSMGSKHLVQLMEFVQLQQSLNSIDDPYGLEMAAYLNDEDIVQPGETDAPSILRFCVSKQNKKKEDIVKKGQKKGGNSKTRRSENLPKFDFLNDKSDESSDEDLPAFDTDVVIDKDAPEKVKTGEMFEGKSCYITEEKEASSESDGTIEITGFIKGFHDVMDISDKERRCDSELSDRRGETSKQVESARVNKPLISKAKSLEKRMNVVKVRKKKKSRQSSGQTSIIKLIADTDSNDFDDAPEVSVVINEKEQDLSYISEQQEKQKATDLQKERYQNLSSCYDSEIDTISGAREDLPSGCFRIRTPPPIENVEKLRKVLERDANLVTFDIFAAVDEWHMENKDGKYIVYPEGMIDEYNLDHFVDAKSTQKKMSVPPAITTDTGSLLYAVTIRNDSDTAVELAVSEEHFSSELIVKNNNHSRDSIGTKSNSGKKKPSDTHGNTKQRDKLLDSPSDQTTLEKEHNHIKSSESILVSNNTRVTMQNEDGDIACTGNFMLNADDVFLSNDDWSDGEKSECSFSPKEKPPTISENRSTIQGYGDDNDYSNGELSSCKKKERNGQVSLYQSGKSKSDNVDMKDQMETKHSFANFSLKESLNSSNESVTNERVSVPFSTVNKTSNDSFLADDKDDDILMDIETPLGNKTHNINTQITFTQALNFVHSGSRTSGSESCSEGHFKETDILPPSKDRTVEMPSPKFSLKNSVKNDEILCDDVLKGYESKRYMKHSSAVLKMSDNRSDLMKLENKVSSIERKKTRKSSSSSEDGVEMPEFDLGFDFDEDIIPPSPEATQASQKPASSRLSQTFAFSHRLGQSQYVADELVSDNKDQHSDESTGYKNIDQHTNVLSKVLKCKKSLKLQRAGFNEHFRDNDEEEESQSLFGDNVTALVRHRNRKSNTVDRIGKVNLEVISENAGHEFIDAEVDITKHGRNDNFNQSKTDEDRQNKNKNHGSFTTNVVDAVVKQGNDDTGEFDASFALLGGCLEDWIDSGVDSEVKENQKHEVNLQKVSEKEYNDKPVNEHSYDLSPASQRSCLAPRVRQNTPVATVNPQNISQISNVKMSDSKNQGNMSHARINKHIRKSIFVMDDLSSDSFDNSIYSTSDLILDKNTPKKTGSLVFGRHNTSTPLASMSKNVTESTHSRMINTKAMRSLESTPIRAANDTPVRGTDSTPVSYIQEIINQSSQDSPRVEILPENDDSFVVRRKKRVQILDSPLSQKECLDTSVTEFIHSQNHNESTTDNNLKCGNRKRGIVFLSSSDNDDNDFDDSVMLMKNRYIVKKTEPQVIDQFSDEDFEELVVHSKKQIPLEHTKKKAEVSVGTRKHSKVTKMVKLKNNANLKRTSNPFIEEEAELSEEGDSAASSDEHEGSDLDAYEGSFIADSQFTESQALDHTDIHALYLKSVKSPPANRGRFKLQYNQRSDVDVFSQRPPPEDSHYMEDSFCVGSEEEEDAWLIGEEDGDSEDEPKEITLMQNSVMYTGRKRRKGLHAFQTSRQREIQMGRMKALSEIRSKLAGKAVAGVQHKQMVNQSSCEEIAQKRNPTKRSRIQIQDDSSSDDDSNFQLSRSSLISPKVQPILNTNKRPRRVLSSDESESEEFLESRSLCRSNKSKKLVDRNEDHIGKTVVKTNISSTLDKQTAEELRKERLKKQREKQEEFRRHMGDTIKTGNSNLIDRNAVCSESGLTKIKEKPMVTNTAESDGFEFAKPARELKYDSTDLLICSSVRKSKFSEKPVILVDSKEISGSQEIISDLRFKHDILVSAAQLPGCDYIVSNRMAVERKQWSEFSNGANRTKLIERMQHLGELYDRPYLIIEKDRVKPGEEKSTRPVHWTKYIDRTMALLLRSEIKILRLNMCSFKISCKFGYEPDLTQGFDTSFVCVRQNTEQFVSQNIISTRD